MKTTRLFLIAPALLSLAVGLLAGLQRIGWTLPFRFFPADHGAIMIGGFLGTLIALEKVLPLKRWFYTIPLISGCSVPAFLLGQPMVALSCLLIASAGLSVVFLIYFTRTFSVVYAMMFVAAGCWFTGNFLLGQTGFYPSSLPWWMAFTLLIIAAERMELMKFLPVSIWAKAVFVLVLLLFVLSCLASFHGTGNFLSGITMMIASIWLMRYDVVGINLRKNNLQRYIGITLLSGYIALLLSGLFVLLVANAPFGYDIIVHSFFIGFVLVMIFGHGPIILPGVLGISAKPYHFILYVWLMLLHASWLMRIIFGLTLNFQGRMVAGVLTTIAIVGYFVTLAVLTLRRLKIQA